MSDTDRTVRPSDTEPQPPSNRREPDRQELTVKDVTQHVHNHPGEPRDLDYRVQALSFAISYEAQNGLSIDVLQTAAKFETYLRNGGA